MKLLKSDLRFEVEGLEGGLDIWFDAENGNEVGENNAWIVVSDIYKWWGIAKQTISDTLKDKDLACNTKYYGFPTTSERSDVVQTRKNTGLETTKRVINWEGFGDLVACCFRKNSMARAILKTWKHYSFEIQVEKSIAGTASSFERLAEESKSRGDMMGYHIYMGMFLREQEWEEKLANEQKKSREVEASPARMVRNIILSVSNNEHVLKKTWTFLREDLKVYDKTERFVLVGWEDLFEFKSVRRQDGFLQAESALCAREGKVEEVRKIIKKFLAEEKAKRENLQGSLFDCLDQENNK